MWYSIVGRISLQYIYVPSITPSVARQGALAMSSLLRFWRTVMSLEMKL
jgi:hypothetical protein